MNGMRPAFLLQVVFLACALCCSATAASTTIRIIVQLPTESLLYQNLKHFSDRVAEQSHGELNIKLFPSSELFKAHEVPRAVGSGHIEMGASLLLQYVEIVPAVDIFSVPFLFSDPAIFEAATASSSGLRGVLDESIRNATGARVLWWVPYGAEAMGSKGSPLRLPSDLAGKRIRVAGSTLAEFIKACGAAAVIGPGPEQYALLQKGKVDGVSTSVEAFVSLSLWELIDHVSLIHHIRKVFVVLINDRIWQGLSEEQRSVLKKAAMEAERLALNQDVVLDREAIAVLARHGMKISDATPTELEEWKACSSPVSEIFLARSGETGEKAIAEYRKLLVGFTGNRPSGRSR
jgi:C4-dicarboxylate-binding protein DctP